MKDGPDIALIASLLGDPARANMLTALMAGGALTAGELAREAGVTAQTASSHVAKLEGGGLVVVRREGRHGYVSLAGDDVARVLEGLMGLAARIGHRRTRPGPRDPALRTARVCYDHLAGDLGVALYEALGADGWVIACGEALTLSERGRTKLERFGIETGGFGRGRRPACRRCLDWSVRRHHLAGETGAAILRRLFDLGWARRLPESRVVAFSPPGLDAFREAFRLNAVIRDAGAP